MRCIPSGIFALLLLAVSARATPFVVSWISVPGGHQPQVYDINDSGDIVGSAVFAGYLHGFVMHGNAVSLIDAPGSTFTFATAINNHGVVAGYDYDMTTGRYHGFIDNGGSFTAIDVPGAIDMSVHGINDAGTVIGNYYNGSAHAFISSGGTLTTLDVPGAIFTQGLGINNNGDVVGYYGVGLALKGFIYSGGTYTTVDTPGTANTVLYDINDRGDLVGWNYTNGAFTSFVEINGARSVLFIPGTPLDFGINNYDDIVGYYATSYYNSFLARTQARAPEPATLLIVATCSVFAFGARHRRKKQQSQRA